MGLLTKLCATGGLVTTVIAATQADSLDSATAGSIPILDYVTGEMYLERLHNLHTARAVAPARLAPADVATPALLLASVAVPGLWLKLHGRSMGKSKGQIWHVSGRSADLLRRLAASSQQLEATSIQPVISQQQSPGSRWQLAARSRHGRRRACGAISALAAVAIARVVRRRALRNSRPRAAALSPNSCAVAVEQEPALPTETGTKEDEETQCSEVEIEDEDAISSKLELATIQLDVDTLDDSPVLKRRLSLSHWWSDEARLDEDLDPVDNAKQDSEEPSQCNLQWGAAHSKSVPHFQLAADDESCVANLRSLQHTPPRTPVKKWAVPDTTAHITQRSQDTGRVRVALHTQKAARITSARGGC